MLIKYVYLVPLSVWSDLHDSYRAGDGRAWGADGMAQALVGPGLAKPLSISLFGMLF